MIWVMEITEYSGGEGLHAKCFWMERNEIVGDFIREGHPLFNACVNSPGGFFYDMPSMRVIGMKTNEGRLLKMKAMGIMNK